MAGVAAVLPASSEALFRVQSILATRGTGHRGPQQGCLHDDLCLPGKHLAQCAARLRRSPASPQTDGFSGRPEHTGAPMR